MHEIASVVVLEELFEEAWQVADLAATSDDRHLAPRLQELAKDVLVWRNRRYRDGVKTSVAADLPSRPPVPPCREAKLDDSLRRMEALVARQQAVVSRLEQLGCNASAEAARDLLSATEEAAAMTRHASETETLAGVARPW